MYAIRPNFFVIGAAKSGTSWLYEQLRAHPSIFLPSTKEPHYWAYRADPELTGPVYPSIAEADRAYHELYVPAEDQVAVGDMSTTNLAVPAAAELIAERAPAARIVAVLRHPVDRAFSHFSHFVAAGAETTDDFGVAVHNEDLRLSSDGLPFTYAYLGWSRYERQLPPFISRYDRDHRLFVLYDDLVADPDAFVAEITDFLQVTRLDGPVSHERVNRVEPGQAPAPPPRRLRERLRSGPLSRRRAAAQPGRPSVLPLAPDTRARLTEQFRDGILAVQDLIGRDLSHWLEPGLNPRPAGGDGQA